MNTQSKKAKGRRLQNAISEYLDELGLENKPAIMGESGIDIKLFGESKSRFPYAIECKNQERLNIWDALKQAESNKGDLLPLLIFKRNRTKTYVAMEWDDFIDLWKLSQQIQPL